MNEKGAPSRGAQRLKKLKRFSKKVEKGVSTYTDMVYNKNRRKPMNQKQ